MCTHIVNCVNKNNPIFQYHNYIYYRFLFYFGKKIKNLLNINLIILLRSSEMLLEVALMMKQMSNTPQKIMRYTIEIYNEVTF